jgi:hypothetical protein
MIVAPKVPGLAASRGRASQPATVLAVFRA